jgi:hypothetical protein
VEVLGRKIEPKTTVDLIAYSKAELQTGLENVSTGLISCGNTVSWRFYSDGAGQYWAVFSVMVREAWGGKIVREPLWDKSEPFRGGVGINRPHPS